jgi:hypothetical protein
LLILDGLRVGLGMRELHAEPWRGAPEASDPGTGPGSERDTPDLGDRRPPQVRPRRAPVRAAPGTHVQSGRKKRDTDDHGGTEDPHQAEGL